MTEMTEAEIEDQLRDEAEIQNEQRDAHVPCNACGALYGVYCSVSLWDATAHEAEVARGYLADVGAEDAKIAAAYLKYVGEPIPTDQAELGSPGGRQFLVPGATKTTIAERFVAAASNDWDPRVSVYDHLFAEWFEARSGQ